MPNSMFQTLYFEDLSVGMRETISKTVENEDVIGFAELSGDHNPIHLSEHFARKTRFGGRIVHGLYTASLISAVIGMRLPGPGAIYISQTLNFLGPVKIGDVVDVSVEVAELTEKGRRVRLKCECRVGDKLILEGEGLLSVPPNPSAEACARLTARARDRHLSSAAEVRTARQPRGLQDAMNAASCVATDPTTPPRGLERAVYAIGNFDGLHIGHRAVLERTHAPRARARGAPSALLTFEPHPADYFAERPVAFRLTPAERKAAVAASLGLSGIVFLTFDAALAGMTRRGIRPPTILVARLGAGAVVVGWDFHFGKGRMGTPAFLAEAGRRYGFAVEIVDKVELGDGEAARIVSSTAIRRALERGDVVDAARGLGRSYAVSGPVIEGQRLGRTLGVPTANIALEPTNRLAHGVYAVIATLSTERSHPASRASASGRRSTTGRRCSKSICWISQATSTAAT